MVSFHSFSKIHVPSPVHFTHMYILKEMEDIDNYSASKSCNLIGQLQVFSESLNTIFIPNLSYAGCEDIFHPESVRHGNH